jgi:GR25 family glycosyltransferase involved in LPS biosynthesis
MAKNMFKIPVCYISFTRNTETERLIHEAGFENVQHFQAIDGRVLDMKSMVLNGKIGSRAYADITNGREQHSGLPGMGAVGCTLSHMSLWQKCLDSESEVMCIAEEDVDIAMIPKFIQDDISACMYNDTPSVYLSTNVSKNQGHHHAIGLQFYFVNKKACHELVKRVFPINEQTDFYICHIANIELIKLNGVQFTRQKSHKSSIQDTCKKCYRPNYCRNALVVYTLAAIICVLLYQKYRKTT